MWCLRRFEARRLFSLGGRVHMQCHTEQRVQITAPCAAESVNWCVEYVVYRTCGRNVVVYNTATGTSFPSGFKLPLRLCVARIHQIVFAAHRVLFEAQPIAPLRRIPGRDMRNRITSLDLVHSSVRVIIRLLIDILIAPSSSGT